MKKKTRPLKDTTVRLCDFNFRRRSSALGTAIRYGGVLLHAWQLL